MTPNGERATLPINTVDLLKHYEEYGVIICKPCAFAIQPSALASHLLKHQIYRSERRRLMAQLAHLKLKDPADVVDPSPLSPPIPELQVYKGIRCLHKDCQHICASEKRMSQHWSDVHGERESKNVVTRPAWLQTFFRGNKIRYFEISGPGGNRSGSLSTVSSPSSNGPSTFSHSEIDSSPASTEAHSLDMDSLRYLLHYTEHTSRTLPRTESESTKFWSSSIPQEALKHPFLMNGLLGLSAFHLARLTQDHDPAQAAYHHQAFVRYQAASLTDFRELTRRPDVSNAVALIAYSRILSIQRCTRDVHDEYKMNWPTQFMYLVRGTVECLVSLQPYLPDGCDFKFTLEDYEGLARLDDEAAISKDSKSIANIPPAMLQRLDQLPERVAMVSDPAHTWDMDNAEACCSACTALIAAYARAYSVNQCSASLAVGSSDKDAIRAIWSGFEAWTRTVSDRYINMLEQNSGPALIVLAHFCVLVKRFEERYWYIKGMPDRIIGLIEDMLEDRYKPFVSDLYHILD
ncbi:hypothetical protein CB0940_05541 [Cercospora beticola]|uniref:C2H2-type domain-containing protein n=1 Tax=Cercospora beticola TaxID=122368 RepID=A0A2G5HZD5_CERBT|nr:hypothetical protein CB0940_05541 [Cercospora beticola]PIA97898.1 hypothetical protein CB0940_05541 [Cercospora beticola]WPA98099.1 hypothetical protein RHO25_002710 [Cercospora beticola]CAK1359312.1 unnamed protein product [Cercospora beticola]